MALPLLPLAGIVKDVLGGFFEHQKDKQTIEFKRDELRLLEKKLEGELELKLREELRKPESDFRSFVLEYEGRADGQHPIVGIIRSTVRPVVTYWALIIITAIMFGWVEHKMITEGLKNIPDQLWSIFLAIFGFWFGGRALMQVVEAKQKGDVAKARVQSDAEREKALREQQTAEVQAETARQEARAELARTPTAAARRAPSPHWGDEEDEWWSN